MRKLILVLFCSMIFIQGCSIDGDEVAIPEENVSEINLPKKSEVFGQEVAREIRRIAINFHNKGIDYTKTNRSASVRKHVIAELYKDAPIIGEKVPSAAKNISFATRAASENLTLLTVRQRVLIQKILDRYKGRISEEEFFRELKIINKEIHQLPTIEQERVFNMSAALYYGLREIQRLRREGLMAPKGMYGSIVPRLKSSSEEGGGEGDCTETESAIAIPVGTEIFIEGLKYVVKESLWVAARAVFVIGACLILTSSSSDCDGFANECASKQWKLENGQWIRMDCTVCRNFCLSNGYWNHTACPLN